MPKHKRFKQDPSTTIKSFSKNLLGLKFMQRAKKNVEEKVEENDDSFVKINNKQQYIVQASYQFCERLRFGRFSFKGKNPEIELIMENNRILDPSAQKRPHAPASSNEDSDEDNEIDNLDTDDEDGDKEKKNMFDDE